MGISIYESNQDNETNSVVRIISRKTQYVVFFLGAMMLGAKAESYAEICQQIVAAMSKEFGMDEHRAKIIRNALQRKHK